MQKTNTRHRMVSFTADQVARSYAHVESMWPVLTREQTIDDGSLIGLPYPYVIPSAEPQNGFVFEEMYYWDSYFIAQGLLASGRKELAEGMLENLLYLMHKLHIIPTANRYYHTSRSQPPLLTSFILDIYDQNEKSTAWLSEKMAVAEKEYRQVWTSEYHPTHHMIYKGLSRYYDVNVLDDLAEAESGWDHTTRFYGRALSFIPIDLNCLLYKYEQDFARSYEICGDPDTAEIWRNKAAYRQQVINEALWDSAQGFYFDLDFQEGTKSNVKSLAAYYALWSGVATTEQAADLVRGLDDFICIGGLAATTETQERQRTIAHQWAHPNGWAPLQWIVIKGLVRYGYIDQAEMIARKWLKTNMSYFEEHGVFREAYNVVSPLEEPEAGVYPPQVGFGWTNAIFVDLTRQFLQKDELQKI